MLARGEVEAALVPVIEYQRLPETLVVPGVCVGARAEVQSVVLVTRGSPLEEVRSVALDTSSRTSAALVEVIFREFVGRADLAVHDLVMRAVPEGQDVERRVVGDRGGQVEREHTYVDEAVAGQVMQFLKLVCQDVGAADVP